MDRKEHQWIQTKPWLQTCTVCGATRIKYLRLPENVYGWLEPSESCEKLSETQVGSMGTHEEIPRVP